MPGRLEDTLTYQPDEGAAGKVSRIMREVHQALKDNGFEPLDQIIGYLISGDPTYITHHRNARVLIRRLERSQILEQLIKSYFESGEN